MDLDDFRNLYQSAGVDIWTAIDMALTVAKVDFSKEFKVRRDQIAERIFATSARCLNCDTVGARLSASKMNPNHKSTLGMEEESNDEEDSHGGEMQNSPPGTPYNDENEESALEGLKENQVENHVVKEVQRIKELLEDSDEHHVLLEALQNLEDMDISVEALKETDIGRQVNALRKQSASTEVKKLAKQLISKWKHLVDEWVNTAGEVAAAAIVDGNSPQAGGNKTSGNNSLQKCQSSHHRPSSQERDSNCSGHKMCDESDLKGKGVKQGSANSVNNTKTGDWSPCESPQLISGDGQRNRNQMKQEAVSIQKLSLNVSSSEKLESARKRLQEKYLEANNAKRQRTVQPLACRTFLKPRTLSSHMGEEVIRVSTGSMEDNVQVVTGASSGP